MASSFTTLPFVQASLQVSKSCLNFGSLVHPRLTHSTPRNFLKTTSLVELCSCFCESMELSAGISLTMLWSFFMQLLLFTSAFSKLGGNDTDRLSLLEFKAKVIDPLGVLNSWNESLHFCEWHGVTCGRRHRRVTTLELNSSNLAGNLAPHIGNLSFMRRLDLENNSFSNEIPGEIGRLFRLQWLHLNNNSFSGKIPINITGCSNLQYLFLFNNNLSGEIPKGLGSITNLKELYLGLNNLHGEIPSSIANLSSSLEKFDVQGNSLHGNIPYDFGQLKTLKFLSLGRNYLAGIIPPSIYNLSSIRVISVAVNRLEGNLPPNLLLPNLEVFLFHTNKFSGQVPIISNSSNLIDFEIGANHLTGKVPDFAGLPNLKYANLGKNNLGHRKNDDLNFLFSLCNCTNLEELSIDDNNLGGVLPECISNFSTKLVYMTFGRNEIEGSIPTGIENLVNLQILGLETNQLVGPIPRSIGKLQKLYGLVAHLNELSGAIPSSLGNLTSLNLLTLYANNLHGRLPSNLGDCRNLVLLDLYLNNLTGPIPKEVFGLSSLSQYLDLSFSYFTGSLPIEVGKLVNLGSLVLSENKLSGEIPKTIGSCQSLEYLYLEGNLLQGAIPQSFDSLKGILEIDLSYNNLSGEIPTYLEHLNLQILNLSFNNFEGEVPTQGVFTNTSALSVMGNTRLCGGIAQLNLPKCPSSVKDKLSSKQKITISVVCALVAIMLLSLLSMLLCSARKRKGKSVLGSQFGISFLEVSYGDLLKATDGFASANLIGTGNFGSVYKGILNQDGGLEAAVKVLNLQTSRALKSFIAECKVLKSIKHRNLVKVLTACSSIDFQGNDFKALVYEFMTNGSLEEWLHSRSGVNSEQARHLNLIQRIDIAIDVANALDYLHHHCHAPIVHCDLKPSNILLDGDMTARVGDFGLARFLSDPSHPLSSYQSSSIGIRGTIGYIAPEYVMGSDLSREGDVYSYGIFLLEMFTGKRPTDEMFKDDFNLHNFVEMSLPERLVQVVDSALLIGTGQVEERTMEREIGHIGIDHVEENSIDSVQLTLNTNVGKCLHSVLKIGISCSKEIPYQRMNIRDAGKELLHVKTTYLGAEIRGDRMPRTG